jgi:lipoic acid synthetase
MVATSVVEMGLNYVVLTSVNRDDLPDGGAEHFACCVEAIKQAKPGVLVEVLVPDFQGDHQAIARLVAAQPDVYAQNQETVRRLTRRVRDARSDYDLTLAVLAQARDVARSRAHEMLTKSSLMLGLGEEADEIEQALQDLRRVGCDVLTLGQYLRPSTKHLRVERWVTPAEFDRWAERGRELGFRYVASGPLVRSSYRAGEYHIANVLGHSPMREA